MRRYSPSPECRRACAAVAQTPGHPRQAFAQDKVRWGHAHDYNVLRLMPRGSKWRRAAWKSIKENREEQRLVPNHLWRYRMRNALHRALGMVGPVEYGL